MASCLHNGDNESFIGLSQSFSISFSDYSGNEIEVPSSSQSIDIWISRDSSFLLSSKGSKNQWIEPCHISSIYYKNEGDCISIAKTLR
jgi:hypothetical protein